jgi:hypothetical protein
MGLPTHRFLMAFHLQDYGQTVTMAKLITGCPLERSHRCPECKRQIEREVKKLFKALHPLVPEDLTEDGRTAYQKRLERQEKHRQFLEIYKPGNALHPSKRKSVYWYCKKFKVADSTVKRWMEVERQRVKGIDRLGKPQNQK